MVLALFLVIHYTSPPKTWGDVSQRYESQFNDRNFVIDRLSLIYHQVRKYLLRLKTEHVKFWRPQVNPLTFIRWDSSWPIVDSSPRQRPPTLLETHPVLQRPEEGWTVCSWACRSHTGISGVFPRSQKTAIRVDEVHRFLQDQGISSSYDCSYFRVGCSQYCFVCWVGWNAPKYRHYGSHSYYSLF